MKFSIRLIAVCLIVILQVTLLLFIWFNWRKNDLKFTNKEIQVNIASVKRAGFPFVFDAEMINVEAYTETSYALEIVSVEIDSSEIESSESVWFETPVVDTSSYKISAPFMWIYKIRYESEHSNVCAISSIDPDGADSKKYQINLDSAKKQILITYRLRSVNGAVKNTSYQLLITVGNAPRKI